MWDSNTPVNTFFLDKNNSESAIDSLKVLFCRASPGDSWFSPRYSMIFYVEYKKLLKITATKIALLFTS